MTNEEAIENLKELLECSYVDSFEDEENEALRMAIKALETIPKYKDAYGKGWVDGAKASYEHLKMCIEEQEPEWIPVSERLPNIHNYYQDYLITTKNRIVGTAFFTETNGIHWWSVEDVIAWMPLPEPYKAESDNCN